VQNIGHQIQTNSSSADVIGCAAWPCTVQAHKHTWYSQTQACGRHSALLLRFGKLVHQQGGVRVIVCFDAYIHLQVTLTY